MKQLKLELPRHRSEEELKMHRGNIELLKKEFLEANYTFKYRYRKKPDKYYFTVSLTKDEENGIDERKMLNANSDAGMMIRQYFPDAYLTSGGYMWDRFEATYAERDDQ